jgi:hypothetical protein
MNRTDLERARTLAPTTDLTLEGLARRRERKDAHRRMGALVVVAAIASLAVGAVFATYEGTGSPASSAAKATEPETWTVPPGLAIPAGSYAYLHRVVYGDVEAYELQSWFSPGDGSGRVLETGTSSDEPLDSGTPGQQIPYTNDKDYASGEMTSGEVPNMDPLDGLSVDPFVLVGQLVERSRPAGASPIPPPVSAPNEAASTAQVAHVIDVLLVRANATPELKAALSQVLAGLEGVTVNSATLDPVGRPAWSVTFDSHAVSETWWFDPQSDQVLVNRVHSEAGGYTFFTVYEASGVVGSTRATAPEPSFIPPTTTTP